MRNKLTFLKKKFLLNRVTLAKLSISHLDDIHEYSTQESFYEHLEFPAFKTLKETHDYLIKTLERHSNENAFYWCIVLKETNKAIGIFGVHDIDWRKLHCEISYGISPSYSGKGLFTEVLSAFLKFIFSHDFYRVCALTSASNMSSIYALKKVGFKSEGVFRNYYFSFKNIRYDANYLALLMPNYKQ